MSAKELLFAAAQLGAGSFYGFPDPFFGMPPAQVYAEIPALQAALERRGLASMGFDGVFSLAPAAAALIAPCVGCRRYLMVRRTGAEGGQQTALLYLDGERAVEADCRGEEVALRAVDADAAGWLAGRLEAAALCAGTGAAGTGQAAAGKTAPCRARLRRQALADAREKVIDDPQQAADALQKAGCCEAAAALLVQGFRRQAEFDLLVCADLAARTLDHAMAVRAAQGALWLTLEDELEDLWLAEYLPGGLDIGRLRGLCGEGGAPDELL